MFVTKQATLPLPLIPTPTPTPPQPYPTPAPTPDTNTKQEYERVGPTVVHRVLGLVDDGLKPGFLDALNSLDALDSLAPIDNALDSIAGVGPVHYH